MASKMVSNIKCKGRDDSKNRKVSNGIRYYSVKSSVHKGMMLTNALKVMCAGFVLFCDTCCVLQ